MARPTTGELGECGEALAALYLKRAGWRLLGRQVRTPQAELDLVALDGDVFVAVEVKTGRGTPKARHAPREHLGRRTLQRQRKALGNLYPGRTCRIDLIEILILPNGTRHLTHLVRLKPKDRRAT